MKHAQAAVSGPPAPGSQCGDTTGPNPRGGRADKSLEILPFSAASVGTGAGYSAQATDRSRSHVAVDGLFPKEERRKPIICGGEKGCGGGHLVQGLLATAERWLSSAFSNPKTNSTKHSRTTLKTGLGEAGGALTAGGARRRSP
jgi:hypothetical protein